MGEAKGNPDKSEERVTVKLIDGETGRCIGIDDYRICGPRPIRGVVVTLWKTTKNDVLRAFLTPDEKHDWLAKELTVAPVEQARLAALVPGLVEALKESATWFHATHRNIWGEKIENCGHEQCEAALTVLNAVAKEREG